MEVGLERLEIKLILLIKIENAQLSICFLILQYWIELELIFYFRRLVYNLNYDDETTHNLKTPETDEFVNLLINSVLF